MARSLEEHVRDLADYLNDEVFLEAVLTPADLLDALASLGITLVEDPIADSAGTYRELLRDAGADPEGGAGSG